MPQNKQSQSEQAMLPGGMPAAEFLRQHWQKQPLLIRNAFPAFNNPVTADVLAGLACETFVESRLVLEKAGPKPWHVEYGPFAESRFASLPESHWTLLVQSVDEYLPEVRQLLNAFTFLPRWRLDDIMISYAAEHGSVGPHLDQYDVFLVQAEGRRRWQISRSPAAEPALLPETELQILKDFSADEEWVLEPGDMLYLPPGVPHYGVALDSCITLSVGFRAPAETELFAGFGTAECGEKRYSDADLCLQEDIFQITPEAIERVRRLMSETLAHDTNIARVFGQLVTEGRSSAQDVDTSDFDIDSLTGATLRASADSRFAYYMTEAGRGLLFVNGEAIDFNSCLLDFVRSLCNENRLAIAELSSAPYWSELKDLLPVLVNMGSIEFLD